MARPSITNISSLGDFATGLHWNMYFLTPPTGAGFTTLSNSDFNFRCISTEVPSYQSQPTQIAIRGHVIKQPGIYTPNGEITFTMAETIDNKVSIMLKSWRELCWASQTGVQQTKANCQATLFLERLDRQDNQIWYYIIYGAFLEAFDPVGPGGLGDMSDNIITPTIRLSYDYFLDYATTSQDVVVTSTSNGNAAGSGTISV